MLFRKPADKGVKDAERTARAIATLGKFTDQYSSAKVVFYPAQELPRARDIAALFRLAGWNTNFIDTPQEGFAHRYFEGVEVSGFNSRLVDEVGRTLLALGTPNVRTTVNSHQISTDNPKHPYAESSVRVTVGHIPIAPTAPARRGYRKPLAVAAVVISVGVSVVVNLATEWKTDRRWWIGLITCTLFAAMVAWRQEER